MTEQTAPQSQPVRTGITWTSRIASILIAGIIAAQQAGIISPQNATTIKTVTEQITPIADRIETAINDRKLPDVQVIIDLATQVKRLADQLQADKTPHPTPLDPKTIPVVTPPVIHTPPPPLLVPTAAITVTDSNRRPITGPVEPGTLFTVTAKGSTYNAIRWTLDPSDPEAVECIAFPDGTGFIGSLKAGGSIGFTLSTAAGDLLETAQTRVTCNRAPQPPPAPIVVNPPKPTPPTPDTDAPLRVLIAFESSQNHTREQLNVLNSTAFKSVLDAKCLPDAGLASWRQWDQDTTGEKDPSATMRDLWKQSLPQAKADGLPALIVARGTAVTVYPLPTTEAAAIALVTGGK